MTVEEHRASTRSPTRSCASSTPSWATPAGSSVNFYVGPAGGRLRRRSTSSTPAPTGATYLCLEPRCRRPGVGDSAIAVARAVPAPDVVAFIAAAPDAVAISPTDAGTVSKPYDARALTGARRSYVAADDTAAVPVPLAAADASADEKSHTGPDALVHVRVHRPQNDGHLVRENAGVNCDPRVLGTLRPVLCRAYAQAGQAPQPQPTPRPTPAPSPRPTLRPTPSPLKPTVPRPTTAPSRCADTKPDAAPIHELSDSGAVAPADDSIPDTGGWQPHGGARCCTDRGPRHRRIRRHLRGDSAGLLRGL